MSADAISIKVRFESVLKKAAVAFIIAAAGFLLGRIELLSMIYPFGPAFVAACFLERKQEALLAAAGVMCAALLTAEPLYIVSVTLILSAAGYFLRQPRRWMLIMSAACAFAISTAIFKTQNFNVFVIAILECMTSLLMIYVLQTIIQTAAGGVRRSIFSVEEKICLTLGALIVVCLPGRLNIMGVFAADIAAIFLVIGAAYTGGASLGAGVGLALGIALCLGLAQDTAFIGMLGVSGMVAGALRRLKKPGVATGFMLVNLLFILAFFGSVTWYLIFIETAAGAALFLVLPEKAYIFAGKYFDMQTRREAEYALHTKRFRELTTVRLKEVSEVFRQTGEMFSKEAMERIKNEADISAVLSIVAESTCKDCVFRKSCWDKDFLNTYNVFERLFIAYEKSGKVSRENIDASFAKKCYNLDGVVSSAESIFGAFLLNVKWNRKVEESRLITGRQLKGVAKVVSDLGREMDAGFNFLESLEQGVAVSLDAVGLRAREVCAESAGGALSVAVRVRNCGEGDCLYEAEKAVSTACGVRMKRSKAASCGSGKYYTLKFEQAKDFTVSWGAASTAKNGVCGDSFSCITLKDGRYMSVLCDGMGSGESAHRESEAAVSLIENFYQAGFDEAVIFDTINRLLLLKDGEEAFTTVDLCIIDMRSGFADFTKIGAECTYILGENGVTPVKPGSPPMGILEDVTPLVIRAELRPGDMIIMMSDGVADCIKGSAESWFSDIPATSPQETAEAVLKKAAGGAGPRDDMTVIANLITRG